MIYFKYIRMSVRTTMQYRSSFWMIVIGQFMVTFFAYLSMALLFDRFGSIAGWTFGEVALCFGVVTVSFAVAECCARGFDVFSTLVRSGEFDRLLIRPRGLILQVLGSHFELSRFGRVATGTLVFAAALPNLSVEWTAMKVATLIMMIISGSVIFSGIFMLGATVCFKTVEGLEFINIFTDGGREIASYPLTIYAKWAARFFTFVIPFGCFNYLPLLYIVGRSPGNQFLHIASPLIGMVFIVPCIWVWNMGVRSYVSAGS